MNKYDLDEFIGLLEKLRTKFGGKLPVNLQDGEIDVIGVFDEDGRDCEKNGGEPYEVYIGR